MFATAFVRLKLLIARFFFYQSKEFFYFILLHHIIGFVPSAMLFVRNYIVCFFYRYSVFGFLISKNTRLYHFVFLRSCDFNQKYHSFYSKFDAVIFLYPVSFINFCKKSRKRPPRLGSWGVGFLLTVTLVPFSAPEALYFSLRSAPFDISYYIPRTLYFLHREVCVQRFRHSRYKPLIYPLALDCA